MRVLQLCICIYVHYHRLLHLEQAAISYDVPELQVVGPV